MSIQRESWYRETADSSYMELQRALKQWERSPQDQDALRRAIDLAVRQGKEDDILVSLNNHVIGELRGEECFREPGPDYIFSKSDSLFYQFEIESPEEGKYSSFFFKPDIKKSREAGKPMYELFGIIVHESTIRERPELPKGENRISLSISELRSLVKDRAFQDQILYRLGY